MVWSEGNMSLKNPVTTPGIDPGTVRLVAQHLNHYATPGPCSGRKPHLNFGSFLLRVISSNKTPFCISLALSSPVRFQLLVLWKQLLSFACHLTC